MFKKDKKENKEKKGGLRRLLFGGGNSGNNKVKSNEADKEVDGNNPPPVKILDKSISNEIDSSLKPKSGSSMFKFGRKKAKTNAGTKGNRGTSAQKGNTSEKLVAIPVRTRFVVKKRGKKPKSKKIERKKNDFNIGKMSRVKNKFYPADVDFRYTSPEEIWVPIVDRQQKPILFSNSARIILDETDF